MLETIERILQGLIAMLTMKDEEVVLSVSMSERGLCLGSWLSVGK